jgi:hypothetical protein
MLAFILVRAWPCQGFDCLSTPRMVFAAAYLLLIPIGALGIFAVALAMAYRRARP